jgi:hypothetical protein
MGIIIRQAHVAAEVIAGTLQGNKELAWVGLLLCGESKLFDAFDRCDDTHPALDCRHDNPASPHSEAHPDPGSSQP